MKSERLSTRVALHPFLAGINQSQLDTLTSCAAPVYFKRGQVIFQEGERANRFYLMEKGAVILESNVAFRDPVVIEIIGPGDLLGWSWMFSPYIWHFTARVIEPAAALSFPGEALREYCEKDNSLGYELFKRMAPVMLRRLQAAREKMLALHAGTDHLEPAVLESPFMDQEFDSD
jgi:CRP/FNR family transcriptional regulator, cyclic AMP receptor protein